MIFLDVTTYFASKAGGIRTYHLAKIAYFARQALHRYVLVYPGARHSVRAEGAAVTLVEAYGPELSKERGGYRFLLDYLRVFRAIRRFAPDVVEVGDPLFTGPFGLVLKKLGLYRGVLVSFFHSDPILTHLAPWAERGIMCALKRQLVLRPVAGLLYRVQRAYDLTVVSSRMMEQRLRARGVAPALVPLGVAENFLEPVPSHRADKASQRPHARLLYVGRLNLEKGIALLREIVPRLLAQEDISLTVVGRGGAAEFFAGLRHPRFSFLGFITDPSRMRDIYDEHDILLAPGAYDSFGLAVLEAMSRGLVVVGPDRGGTAELLRSANSPFLFAAGDPDDFFRVAVQAAGSDRTAEAARSRAVAERHGSLEAAIGRLVEVYAARLGRTRLAAAE
jgi:alpha-1,6-mannosyltransferase